MSKQEISFYDKEQTDALLNGKANTSDLSTVAFTGDYDDLADKPIIPPAQVNADWNAVSGVAEILNKPTIPAAQVNADWDAVSGVAQILNKPTIPPAQVNADWDAVSGVAEILNKPNISVEQDASGISVNGTALQIADLTKTGLISATLMNSLNYPFAYNLYVLNDETYDSRLIAYNHNPITGTTQPVGIRFAMINGRYITKVGGPFAQNEVFYLANDDLSNVNVGSANAGKFLKVKSDGTLEYDTPSGTVSITDNTTYFTISY